MSTARFERLWVTLSAATVATLLVWAMVAARCSDARDAALRHRAATAETVGERCRAMNSLCLRGYWDRRSATELNTFLTSAPPDVRAFVQAAHFTLLAERPAGRARKGGC